MGGRSLRMRRRQTGGGTTALTGKRQPNANTPRRSRFRWGWLFALCLAVCLQFVVRQAGYAFFASPGLPPESETLLGALAKWMRVLLREAASELLRGTALGTLVALCVQRTRHNLWRYYQVSLILLFATLLASSAVDLNGSWLLFRLGLLATGGLLGLVVAGELQLGFRGLVHLIGLALLAGIGLGCIGYRMADRLISSEPLAIRPQLPHVAQRDAVVDRVGDKLFQDESDTEITIDLTHHEVDVLANWALATHFPDRPLQLKFDADRLNWTSSFKLPGDTPRFLNVKAAGRARIEQRQIDVEFASCRIGSIHLPAAGVKLISELVSHQLNQSRQARQALSPIRSLTVGENGLRLAGDAHGLRRSLQHLTQREIGLSFEQVNAIGLYVTRMLERADQYREGEDRFRGMIHEAFVLAAERSEDSDPVEENRHALLALGYVLGDTRIEPLLGDLESVASQSLIKERMGHNTLQGRGDWAKHFALSGALVALSNPSVAGLLGQWKERWDAHGSGSGFSFGDLLADEAGSRMAELCLRDAPHARLMQQRLTEFERVVDLFPRGRDLPEGISAEEFETRYGGGQGAEYERLHGDILDRIRSRPVLAKPTAAELQRYAR